MGNWKLEVFKMACYMAFPVGSFYMFNRPELFFEQAVIDIRQRLYPPEDPEKLNSFNQGIKEIRVRQQEKDLELQQALYEKKLAQSARP